MAALVRRTRPARRGCKIAGLCLPPPFTFAGIRHMSNAFDYCLRLVTHARQPGIKAVRVLPTAVPTVRK